MTVESEKYFKTRNKEDTIRVFVGLYIIIGVISNYLIFEGHIFLSVLTAIAWPYTLIKYLSN